jgi:hypothetical protein
VLVATLTTAPALAFPHIDVTNAETLSTSPLRVKTIFTVTLVGWEPYGPYQWIDMTSSGAGPAAHFYEGSAPSAEWEFYHYPPGYIDNAVWNYQGYGYPWTGPQTFSIVTDQNSPCVRMDFANALLSKTPVTNNDYVVEGCLTPNMATPVRVATWGTLKGMYR